MKNPWKLMTILLAVLFIISLVWQYYTVKEFDAEFQRLEAKSQAILDYAKEQGVTFEGNDELAAEAEPVNPEDVSADDDPYTGDEDAQATLIVFDDFECPFCGKMHETLSEVRPEFTGQELRIVYRDFPLAGHENAEDAAKAAGAAGKQGKFVEMADLIFVNQAELGPDKYKEWAEQLGLDVDQFEVDMNSDEVAAEIAHDFEEAQSYGINGTPTVYLNGEKIGGWVQKDELIPLIQEKLAE